MTKTYKWAGFTVTVANDGEGQPPWDPGGCGYRYRIRVARGPVQYNCPAWGSIADWQAGNDRDHESIGAMVLDELASAYCDPDEFAALAVGDGHGLTAQRLRQLAGTLEAAQDFGESLLDATKELRDAELV